MSGDDDDDQNDQREPMNMSPVPEITVTKHQFSKVDDKILQGGNPHGIILTSGFVVSEFYNCIMGYYNTANNAYEYAHLSDRAVKDSSDTVIGYRDEFDVVWNLNGEFVIGSIENGKFDFTPKV
jgi:hypothetical protein